MPFIHNDFLLSNDTAQRLFHQHAAAPPIYDYHCHLPPQDLASNRRFGNLFEIWLAGDHYKWRAMRANGVSETYCTGEADPWDKFLAWARTVPHTLRNPLYHWTHLELNRYFGIDVLLNEDTAREVWDEANRQLAKMDVASILAKFNVALVSTTDDPVDDLAHIRQLGEASPYPDTAIHPALRPDKTYALNDVASWNAYVDRVGQAAGVRCDTLGDYLDALRQRHEYFHQMGCRLSDHGLDVLPAVSCSEKTAKDIFKQARDGQAVCPEDRDRFLIHLMSFFGRLNAEKGWVQQLHLGALRSVNSRRLREIGPDSGFDSIGDWNQAQGLGLYLDAVENASPTGLPKTILYNLNPADNYVMATMIGNFQDGSAPGKIQFGSGWWFLDQDEAMRWQINALSNLGLLTRFVGMLTDSRSFLSYPRHEYFRRVLCDLLGHDVEAGRVPDDPDLLGRVVENICFNNARDYFGMAMKGRHGVQEQAVEDRSQESGVGSQG